MPILDWFNKKEALKTADKTPYKVLVENKDLSYGDQTQGNMIIKGDNLEALKALLPYYKGRVKCIYIDPPYNTGSAFEHYDDNLEHSTWLSLMYPRLELLRELLAENGSIWISIDAEESHYLKVICDEIFGRKNFIDEVVWQRAFAPVNLKKTLSRSHDIILVYAKNFAPDFTLNTLPRSSSQLSNYKNPDNDPRGVWTSADCTVGPVIEEKCYPITLPSGRVVYPPQGRCWVFTQERFQEMKDDKRIWFGAEGNNAPRVKKFLSDVKQGVVATTLWMRDEVGDNQEAKREIKALNFPSVFSTPKPERLLERILILGSNKGDLVLDSFLGSGTTAAVAQKMGRKYIGIEMGEHAITHCAPRLQQVTDGTDQGGISKAVNWTGGSGFTFYDLGRPIFDEEGNINHGISFKDLAFHVWFSETKTPMQNYKYSPLLGIYKDTAYYLLYNGVLGDKRVNGGNVLTSKVLESLPSFDGPKVIYGESCRLSPERLKKENIIFKQTPYEITAR